MNFDESKVRRYIHKSRTLPYAATYKDAAAVILKPLKLVLHTYIHIHSL